MPSSLCRHPFAAALCTLAACAALPAQEAPTIPPLDGQIEQKDGRFRFPKVADWKFTRFETSPIDEQLNAAFAAWSFLARTKEFGNIDVAFVLLNGARPTPRLQAIYDRYGKIASKKIAPKDYRIVLEPVVHATYPISDDRHDVIVYLPANGRMLSLRYTLDTARFEKALPVLLHLAAHVEVNLPPWPARPDGYDYEPESGLLIAFDQFVDKKRRKEMHKFVREIVKDFTKEHAAPVLDPSAPVVLFVSDDKDGNAKLVGSDRGYSADFNLGLRRVVTISVHPQESRSVSACRAMLYRYLSWTLCPDERCMWLQWGIRELADSEGLCGKPLPRVPESQYGKLVGVTKRLEQVTLQTSDIELVEAASWLAYFRLAPSKQRKAFEQLLEELRTGTDPQAAGAAFIEPFDQLELQKDARKVLRKKLKPVKKR